MDKEAPPQPDNPRRERAERLAAMIEAGGGRVVSVLGTSPVRFEVASPSDLPVNISHLCRNVICLGQHEKISPTAVKNVFRETVDGKDYERVQYAPGIVMIRQFEAHV
jgi:hypothetical protein